jgi:hypothetical protein
MVQYEPFVNNTVQNFLQQLRVRFSDKSGPSGIVDLPRWLHWYAFDVIGELTYEAPFGFLKTGSDVDGIIGKAHFTLCYNQYIRSMPWPDSLLLKNRVLLWLNRRGYLNSKPNPVVSWALKRQQTREAGERQSYDDGRVDLIDRFLQGQGEAS